MERKTGVVQVGVIQVGMVQVKVTQAVRVQEVGVQVVVPTSGSGTSAEEKMDGYQKIIIVIDVSGLRKMKETLRGRTGGHCNRMGGDVQLFKIIGRGDRVHKRWTSIHKKQRNGTMLARLHC